MIYHSSECMMPSYPTCTDGCHGRQDELKRAFDERNQVRIEDMRTIDQVIENDPDYRYLVAAKEFSKELRHQEIRDRMSIGKPAIRSKTSGVTVSGSITLADLVWFVEEAESLPDDSVVTITESKQSDMYSEAVDAKITVQGTVRGF